MKLAGQPIESPHHIYGINFSGAQDAGKKIWIAERVVKTDSLLIEDCFRARDLKDSGNELGICLPALKGFIKENQDAAFGLDFPFGLPYVLVEQESWKESLNRHIMVCQKYSTRLSKTIMHVCCQCKSLHPKNPGLLRFTLPQH